MTPVRQIFSWNTVDNRPFMAIEQWISTLTESEQKEFQEARNRQDMYRQEAIDSGLMTIDKNGDYIWRDSAAVSQGKKTDMVWYSYFQRWQTECRINLENKFVEE